ADLLALAGEDPDDAAACGRVLQQPRHGREVAHRLTRRPATNCCVLPTCAGKSLTEPKPASSMSRTSSSGSTAWPARPTWKRETAPRRSPPGTLGVSTSAPPPTRSDRSTARRPDPGAAGGR